MAFPRLSFVAILLAWLLAACEAAFDPTAPQGSTPYVMCVLDAKDSAHYVRVQRSYISRENAYNLTHAADSLYYPHEKVEVYLTRFDTLDGSIMDDPVRLHPCLDKEKEPGLFATEGHYLFKTTENIYPDFEYELSIHFPDEGKRISSRIKPLGSWNFEHAFETEQRKTRYSWYNPERIEYFMDLTPNSHQQITRFLYVEMTPADTARKYIEYFHDYDAYTSGEGDFDGIDFLGEGFLYRLLSDQIEENPEARRLALGVDFMIQLADSNLLTYQLVGDPQGTYMYSPEFSNFRNGGVGLFASRYKLTIFGKALKPDELDSISMGRLTRHLNFADSKGQFHIGGI